MPTQRSMAVRWKITIDRRGGAAAFVKYRTGCDRGAGLVIVRSRLRGGTSGFGPNDRRTRGAVHFLDLRSFLVDACEGIWIRAAGEEPPARGRADCASVNG
jgi:hypothetical protein